MRTLPWVSSSFPVAAMGPEEDDDGCDHSDHSEESDADSPDTDAG